MIAIKTEHSHSILETAIRTTTLAVVSAILLALAMAPAARAQTFTLLHEFVGSAGGSLPPSGVVLDQNGNLYGVMSDGGPFNYGIVYEMDPSGKQSLLHGFIGTEGLWPVGRLLRDPAGNIYGTTADGGAAEGGGCAHGCGTVFKRDVAGQQSVLYGFTGRTDGGNPGDALIRDAGGNLYGTTINGGVPSCYVSFGCGVIFKLDTSNHETVLHSFTDGTDGKEPLGLIEDNSGNLYGTTYDGGAYGRGCVFKLDQAGTFTVLHSFTGGADSDNPNGHLIMDAAGTLYGTTNSGLFGIPGFGVVYKLDTAGNFTILHSFTQASDGEYPTSLVMDGAGNLYGVTAGGGPTSGCYYNSCGTVFKIDTGGNKTVLHNFSGRDGQLPNSLTMDQSGNLYGTAQGGGKPVGKNNRCYYYHGCGVVFKLTP